MTWKNPRAQKWQTAASLAAAINVSIDALLSAVVLTLEEGRGVALRPSLCWNCVFRSASNKLWLSFLKQCRPSVSTAGKPPAVANCCSLYWKQLSKNNKSYCYLTVMDRRLVSSFWAICFLFNVFLKGSFKTFSRGPFLDISVKSKSLWEIFHLLGWLVETICPQVKNQNWIICF